MFNLINFVSFSKCLFAKAAWYKALRIDKDSISGESHWTSTEPLLLPSSVISWWLFSENILVYITGINPEAVLMVGDHHGHPLCPGLQPGLPSQTPGGLGQRYWSVSVVTWP